MNHQFATPESNQHPPGCERSMHAGQNGDRAGVAIHGEANPRHEANKTRDERRGFMPDMLADDDPFCDTSVNSILADPDDDNDDDIGIMSFEKDDGDGDEEADEGDDEYLD
jgi:hypothetical protein